MFYDSSGKKFIPLNLEEIITQRSLAYWVMCDGSLQGNTMILNSQGFTRDENLVLSSELNTKFGFHSEVISHKDKYWVIRIPHTDANKLRNLIKPRQKKIFFCNDFFNGL